MKFHEYKIDSGVCTITLNRPQIHNAFNDELIEELITSFTNAQNDNDCRVIVLTGNGRSFCAGADLNWMSSMVNFSMEENVADSKRLAALFQTINSCAKPVIGKINGAALGGGVGLVCVCDYVITHDKSKFGFTETRLGLIPAVISPYCIKKIGHSNARAWFISGQRFDAHKALAMNLVHEVTSVEDFEEKSNEVIASFMQAGPNAMVEAKKLVFEISNLEDKTDYTTKAIAKLRISSEGQEGMNALLEKRKASWINE
ncbi:MAG: enoyl-CoA hydratase-related protein [Bacteriovoracaceae bacterium]|nr:enoyl-CoA hydratase-related protein [Bacteriovoracaceae bacterium]